MSRRLFFAIGFGLWLLATLVFRLGGHRFFLDDEPAVLALLWLVAIVALFLLATGLFRWRRLTRAQQFEAAALLVISGMALDAFVTEGFALVFPNMPADAAGSFGAWLLIAYASVLIAAFIAPGGD